jgi:hypothetical protein
MHQHEFKFNMGQTVKIAISGESGTVKGCAEYAATENNYLVLYKAADGRAVEHWWGESALEASE